MRLSPFAAILLAIGASATAASAQESTNRVAAQTDWAVFVEDDPKECWGVSAPKETVNTRDGREVSVQRGDILFFVSYRPAEGVNGQISYTPGYVFSSGSTVTLQVGDATFQMFTDGEWAWLASAAEDARILTELKRGTSAVLTGLSSRGTQTKDTFSLLGFTAVAEEAERRCAG